MNLLEQDEVGISRQLMAVRVTGAAPNLSTRFSVRRWTISSHCPLARQSQGFLANKLGLTIALPPLPEQQRIVGILDEAFDGIATAKANAEKNLQNARALFASHLNSVFTQRGPGWVERRLMEVVNKSTDGTLSYGIVQPGIKCPNGLRCPPH